MISDPASRDENRPVDQLTAGRTRSHLARRLVLPAVAAAVVLAAAALVLETRTSGRDAAPPAGTAPAQLGNIVWSDPHSPGTVVYTGSTMRVFDGCRDRLAYLIIRHDRLIEGRTLGPASVCGGQAVPANAPGERASAHAAQRRLDHFYAVIAGPASWSRAGAVLALTTRGKGTLRLTAGGAAPVLADVTWRLVHYMGTDGYEHEAATPLTLAITAQGRFQAELTCGAVRGHATFSATGLRFGDVQSPHCTDPASTVIAAVIRSGAAQYAIRGNQLIITATSGMLIYQP